MKQSLAEAVFAAITDIRRRIGFSPLHVLLKRQPILPAFLRTKENTPEVIQEKATVAGEYTAQCKGSASSHTLDQGCVWAN